MGKYTETEVLNAIKTMGLFRTPYPKDVVEKVVNNTLKIADRLEQADIKKVIANNNKLDFKGRKIVSKEEMGYRDGFLDGYEQALADIRGDNNG